MALRLLVGAGLVGVLPMYNLMEGEWRAGYKKGGTAPEGNVCVRNADGVAYQGLSVNTSCVW